MVPNTEGVWRWKPDAIEIDVYLLEPTGHLCLWGPDVGITYSGSADHQTIWLTDEWAGHIPVDRFDNDSDDWEFVRDFH